MNKYMKVWWIDGDKDGFGPSGWVKLDKETAITILYVDMMHRQDMVETVLQGIVEPSSIHVKVQFRFKNGCIYCESQGRKGGKSSSYEFNEDQWLDLEAAAGRFFPREAEEIHQEMWRVGRLEIPGYKAQREWNAHYDRQKAAAAAQS